ncbi:MAG: hypothetical protein ACSLFK_06095, partial [Gemmatimonadaceae bacterium]
MSRLKGSILLIGAAFALSQAPDIATGQGKGQGKGQSGEAKGKSGAPGQAKAKGQSQNQGQAKGKAQGQAKGASQGRGQQSVAPGRSGEAGPASAGKAVGRSARGQFVRIESPSSMPQSVRRFATSSRAQDVIAAAAVSHAFARGRGDEVRLVQDGNGIRIANLRGDALVYLDESRARDLGRWRVGVIGDETREGSPSFCRSGEGHPVWGRDWCIDKGFGLGGYQDYRWGRTNDVGRIVFPGGGLGTNLIGSALESVIGTSA